MRTAAEYHAFTSYRRDKMSGHSMDWANQPEVFKRYPGIEAAPLPRDVELPGPLLSEVLRGAGAESRVPRQLGVEDLSRIFLLTYTLTAKAAQGGGDFYFRNAASAGALYPTEMYAASAGVEGLEDGLYHFSIAKHGLSLLRKGEGEAFRVPELTFYLTAIFLRSAWKYRDRAYRYHLLDTGHVLENLTLALKAMNLPFGIAYDFDDKAVNEMLGVDEERETVLAVCRVPGVVAENPGAQDIMGDLPEGCRAASRVSKREAAYPAIREIHDAGMGITALAHTPPFMAGELGIRPERWNRIDALEKWPETMNCTEALFRRRSSRNYVPEPISADSLSALVEGLCLGDPDTSGKSTQVQHTLGIGMLIGHARGSEPGLYLVDPSTRSWGPAAAGRFADRMARICLDQGWLQHASLHVLFMANLAAIDRYWGPRGYRYAMLNAGRLGQRLYVQATAMGLGCCGIGALYDEEAAALLQLNPSSRLLYLVAVGRVKAIRMRGE